MKNILIGLLTVLMLPFTALASTAIIALLLAAVALLSPVLLIGGSIVAAAKLATKITNWFYPADANFAKHGKGPIVTSLALTTVLFPLSLVPVAIASVATAAVVSVLLLPAMAGYGAYSIADKAISRLFSALGLTTQHEPEITFKHSYSKLPQDSDEKSVGRRAKAEPEEVQQFGGVFQRKINSNSQLINDNLKLADSKQDSTSSRKSL